MTQYIALTCTADVDWSAPEQAAEMEDYIRFSKDHAASIRGGGALYQTATATTVRSVAAAAATWSPAWSARSPGTPAPRSSAPPSS